jgi:hypothetical protein
MSKGLVDKFNALPRKPRAPSGRVPNNWHFDIRYVQLEPTPCHVMLLTQPDSRYTHVERLPLGLPSRKPGLEFFPETAEEAAPGLVKALLHSFLHSLGTQQGVAAFAPWILTTEDKSLAEAVGQELKRVGVQPSGLHEVGVSSPSVLRVANDVFGNLFDGIKESMGLHGLLRDAIHTPDSIRFVNGPPSTFAIQEDEDDTDDDRHMKKVMEYFMQMDNGSPSGGSEYDAETFHQNMMIGLEQIERLLKDKPESLVKAEADLGDGGAALDYGIR